MEGRAPPQREGGPRGPLPPFFCGARPGPPPSLGGGPRGRTPPPATEAGGARCSRGADLPTETVTFLFTDVEGSTRLLLELGPERYAEALGEHRRVVRSDRRDGGVEVDTQGDSFFVAFPTAPDALAAAAEITDELATGRSVRIGLHTGTPLVTEEGYVGDDVHRRRAGRRRRSRRPDPRLRGDRRAHSGAE